MHPDVHSILHWCHQLAAPRSTVHGTATRSSWCGGDCSDSTMEHVRDFIRKTSTVSINLCRNVPRATRTVVARRAHHTTATLTTDARTSLQLPSTVSLWRAVPCLHSTASWPRAAVVRRRVPPSRSLPLQPPPPRLLPLRTSPELLPCLIPGRMCRPTPRRCSLCGLWVATRAPY